jgi:hypothetical protein
MAGRLRLAAAGESEAIALQNAPERSYRKPRSDPEDKDRHKGDNMLQLHTHVAGERRHWPLPMRFDTLRVIGLSQQFLLLKRELQPIVQTPSQGEPRCLANE